MHADMRARASAYVYVRMRLAQQVEARVPVTGLGECYEFLGPRRIYNCPALAALCSAYSNSYVTSLAVFKADRDRPRLSSLVGEDTERLIHLFCNVPRCVSGRAALLMHPHLRGALHLN